MTMRFIGPYSGYLPQASGAVIAFIRDPAEWKINEYTQYVGYEAPVGTYTVLGRDESVRVVSIDEFRWDENADMPTGDLYKTRFEVETFRCQRYAFPFNIGGITLKTAKYFNPRVTQMAEAISMCMTVRTQQAVTLLETASNWGPNTLPASQLNGGAGTWDKASDLPDSPNFMAIKKTLMEALRRINLYTNGKVKPKDMRLIISPGLAQKMALSAEIVHYLANSVYAKKEQEDPGDNINVMWGLPKQYCGIPIVVEDAVRVSERADARATATSFQASNPGNRNFIKSDQSAVLISRPGGLDGTYGERSYSTLTTFYFGGDASEKPRNVNPSEGKPTGGLLAVKAEFDQWNERMKCAISEFYVHTLTAPPAGFLITGTLPS